MAGVNDGLKRVAVLGLGAMGSVVARNLASLASVSVYDPLAERRDSVATAAPVTVANSANLAAKEADVVVVVVADGQQAEAALFGPEGAAAAMSRSGVVLMMSTIGPNVMRDLAERLTQRGVSTLDSPMTGGSVRAAKGELILFVSGERERFEEVMPLFKTTCSETFYVGATPGEGQMVKLVNQLICAIHMVTTAEALAFAKRLGLDQHAVLSMLEKGAASCFTMTAFGPRMIDGPYQPPASALPILLKDSALVQAEARAAGFETPILDACHSVLLRGGQSEVLARDDVTGIIRLYLGDDNLGSSG